MSEIQTFVFVCAAIWIGIQTFECARYLGKIYRLLIVMAGQDKFRESIGLER